MIGNVYAWKISVLSLNSANFYKIDFISVLNHCQQTEIHNTNLMTTSLFVKLSQAIRKISNQKGRHYFNTINIINLSHFTIKLRASWPNRLKLLQNNSKHAARSTKFRPLELEFLFYYQNFWLYDLVVRLLADQTN